jgi:hypothetical protein
MRASSIRKSLLSAAACVFAVAALPAQAQLSTTANGPYYATPSWDQKLATNRFVILANWNSEAVLDRETGLVWEKSPDTSARNWFNAQGHCNNRSVGGRKGWRQPGVQELASLVDPTTSPGPTLPAGHPFVNVQSAIYWSGTTDATVPSSAWAVGFNNGGVGLGGAKSNTYPVWCVRGGQVPEAQ